MLPSIRREKAAAASTPPAKGKKRRREIFILPCIGMVSCIKQLDLEQLYICAEASGDSAPQR